MLNLQGKVAQNHRQGEILQISRPRMQLVPLAFRIIHLGKDNIESFPGNVCIFLIAGSKT